ALLDILTGHQSSSGRVPPLAMALAGLLTYSKLKNPGGEGAAPADGPSVATARLRDDVFPCTCVMRHHGRTVTCSARQRRVTSLRLSELETTSTALREAAA